MKKQPWSWGCLPLVEQRSIILRQRPTNLNDYSDQLLPHGYGRSYGDVALNDGGIVLSTSHLDRFIQFDKEQGILECESGVSLKTILELIVPHGWFLPVTPGTQFVSVGGAIANDVHGKNHHSAGTFGQHVRGFDLLRTDRPIMWCSPTENSELYTATIGGLGLTGLITRAVIKLKPIIGGWVDSEDIPFQNLDEGIDLFFKHQHSSEYTVAWVDCLASGDSTGRGIFSHANHSKRHQPVADVNNRLSVPFNFPSFSLNTWSVKAFNYCYYSKSKHSAGCKTSSYIPFFYPLDGIGHWNRIYGSKGFYQHQSVIPYSEQDTESINTAKTTIQQMLQNIACSGNASFLAVLKTLGQHSSPGLLSFPCEGITLALDFPNKGDKTLQLLEQLDQQVIEVGGRVYPAKDARMSADTFAQSYPNKSQFEQFIDPQFSSSFWQRISGTSS